MGTTSTTNVVKNIQKTLTKNAPKILTGVGILGMVGSTVMAVKATPKAIRILEKKKEEARKEKLTPVEAVKATWKCYIPATVTGVASIACLIKANSISTRRNAALVTAYNLSKTALTEYKDKVVETIGEKKEQLIQDQIAKDKLEKDPVDNHEVIVSDKGTTLFYDGVFGRYFYSDIDLVKRAITNINRAIVSYNYISLNEFYSEIGLPPVEIGDELGWNFDDGEIREELSPGTASDGRPCLVLRYSIAPKRDYFNFS